MTFSNHTNSIISQAIKSAVDGVLEKSRHERQELLRDFIETAARVFILQRTTQDCEEGDEADVFKDNLFAETNQDQHQLLELEDPHDQVRDFVGAPIYDDYGDDFYREPCHISDVMTKEGDTSPQRKLLSPIDIHEINDNMTRETLFGRPIVTNDVKSYYVPVTNLTDEPIYDVSDDEVFIDSHYCLDPLFNDEDEVQGLNNGIDVHVVVDDGNICVRKEGIKYYLGEKDCHQQFHRNPPDRDKNHTYGAPFVTHNRRSIGSSNTRFMEETGKSEFSMEPAYGVGKEEVRIQDECNEFDVQQREFLQFPMTRCGIGVNKLDGTTKVSPSHDIVKLESMDKKRGYMWLIENSTHESFSFSLTDAEEEARDYAIASVICRTYIGPSHHVQKIYMRFPMTKTPQLFVGVTLLAYQASPCLGPYFAQEESVFIFLSSLLDFYWWIFSIW
ncbi:hypothetical protein IGI04_033974 [Brassica rapa subsp. trilocularis]|uniref:Uncharacterized protein n=1 Tax=Brassica rapa subsp. trilocularis TaxID=1813537 RepID=A0ABQ7L7D0_BRACM|nr:hypothetical protein IGI04_033974 [Brassica rapa subsp. trilocularis]